jgi:glutathione S-transferase
MITLYHCVDARSFRALWALEEVGVPYELRMLPFPPRYLRREYLRVNPLGTIPFMIDGETRMTESAAICQYLAERYAGPPLAVRTDEPGYGEDLNASHCGEATLNFPQTLVLRYSMLEPPERRLPQAVLRPLDAWPARGFRGAHKWRGLCRRRPLHRRRRFRRIRAHDAQGRGPLRPGTGVAHGLLRARA